MCKFIDARDNKFLKVSRRLLYEVSNLDDPTSVGVNNERVKDLLKLVPPQYNPSGNQEAPNLRTIYSP